MGPIDRLGWVDGFSVRPTGSVIGVRSNEHWMLERIRREVLLPHWEIMPFKFHFLLSLFVGGEGKWKGSRTYSLLYDGPTRLARSLDVEEVFAIFVEHFHHRVACFGGGKLFVSSLCLEDERGAHVILNPTPGLRAACRGRNVLSERYAVLDEEGQVHAYRKDPQPPLRLARLWVVGEEEGDLTPAQASWHLFSRLRNDTDAADSLRTLGRIVRARAPVARQVSEDTALRALPGLA